MKYVKVNSMLEKRNLTISFFYDSTVGMSQLWICNNNFNIVYLENLAIRGIDSVTKCSILFFNSW